MVIIPPFTPRILVASGSLLCLLVLAVSPVLAQAGQPPAKPGTPPPTAEATRVPTAAELAEEAQRAYAKRLTQERIDDHYIPKDVLDAMRELDRITSVASQTSYASREEDFVVKRLYFSFGRWMGVNWSLYDGSRLSAHLRSMGVDQPDGQIDMLMRLYHRHLNGKDLEIKELAEAYKENKAREEAERIERIKSADSLRRAGSPAPQGNRPRG